MKRSGPLARKTPLKRTALKSRPKGDPPELRRAREVVRQRSDGWCQAITSRCIGIGRHAHHRQMRSQHGSHEPDNLLWVCHPCHNEIHRNPAHSYDRGWLIRGIT